MATSRTNRNPLFRGRWFKDELILVSVRWYLRYALSYRDLVEMMSERGVTVAHTTILRWVIAYAGEFEKRWKPFAKQVWASWRVDETYIKVNGEWTYLYRAVDQNGRTVDFFLSKQRDVQAAKAFFRKAIRNCGEPMSITLDAYAASHRAVQTLKANGELYERVRIRSCKYLNNIVEQDHRRIKRRIAPMLGFKRFENARIVLAGVELAQKIRKQQFDLRRLGGSAASVAEMWASVLAE